MIGFKLHLLASAASLVAACAIMAGPAVAAAPAGAATHDHAAASVQPSLDPGRRWATDEPLRQGMNHIRGVVQAQLPKAHQGQLTPAQYAVLAAEVDTAVGGIVANCKLEPKADAVLHTVIGDVAAGTYAMAGKNPKVKPQQGLVQVAAALNRYGQYFDDPGFKPIDVGH